MNYLDSLNERQREAVLATEGPFSILAGAGSGKTRVLTSRINHLIREGTAPEHILAVTFTNKAAREMRERLAVVLGDGSLPFIATFHGLGRELLQSYGSRIGVSRYFSVYDRDDSERVIKHILKELDIDPKEVPPRSILARISKSKGQGVMLPEYMQKFSHSGFKSRLTADVWGRYDEALQKEKSLDFDDLIAKPVQMLRDFADVREHAQARWKYIHIDEYQDTSSLQAELADMLVAKHRNLFVVGDIDQCVYSWRGATIENLLLFEETYPEAKTIILEHNYRSTKTIVEASNSVIEKNRNRKDKRAVTDNAVGERITLQVSDFAELEAKYVAFESQNYIDAGTPAREIAVLYRTNFQSRGLEEAFLKAGIPYRLLGTKFLDRKEVKDVLAWVRLALEPARQTDMVRAVQSPPRGIGKVTIAKIAAGKLDGLTPAVRAKIDAFQVVVHTLHEESKTLAPNFFIRRVLELSGMQDSLSKGGEDDAERLENAKELATLASRYDNLPGQEGIANFLADAALGGDQDELDRPRDTTNSEGVTLMTVHASKGLEFEVVFVTGMEEGLFPHESREQEEPRDEEEERRLFYVAMTRAKKHLILTMARVRRIYGTDFMSEPSSFIHDIDAGLMEVFYGDEGAVIR